jgi:hypothetical protein
MLALETQLARRLAPVGLSAPSFLVRQRLGGVRCIISSTPTTATATAATGQRYISGAWRRPQSCSFGPRRLDTLGRIYIVTSQLLSKHTGEATTTVELTDVQEGSIDPIRTSRLKYPLPPQLLVSLLHHNRAATSSSDSSPHSAFSASLHL